MKKYLWSIGFIIIMVVAGNVLGADGVEPSASVGTLVNYGAMGICLAYFIYKDNTTMKENTKAMTEIKEVVGMLNKAIETLTIICKKE